MKMMKTRRTTWRREGEPHSRTTSSMKSTLSSNRDATKRRRSFAATFVITQSCGFVRDFILPCFYMFRIFTILIAAKYCFCLPKMDFFSCTRFPLSSLSWCRFWTTEFLRTTLAIWRSSWTTVSLLCWRVFGMFDSNHSRISLTWVGKFISFQTVLAVYYKIILVWPVYSVSQPSKKKSFKIPQSSVVI